jgi:hypothetical protein
MSWRSLGRLAMDSFVILSGLAISTPFFLIVWSAFAGGL